MDRIHSIDEIKLEINDIKDSEEKSEFIDTLVEKAKWLQAQLEEEKSKLWVTRETL